MGSKKSSTPPPPYEAPNSLISISNYKILDLLCEGPISGFVVKNGPFGSDPLCSVYYDDVPVRNSDGSYNYNVSGQGYNFDYRNGTVNQTPIAGFETISNTIPLNANPRVANPPAGAGLQKSVVASFNTATYPDANAITVTARVPSLLTMDKDGNINGFQLKYVTEISLTGGPWQVQPEVSIIGKCTDAYLKDNTYILPKPAETLAAYDYKVRVRRTTQNILSSKTSNELFIDAITVNSSNYFNYPNSALVATEISSDQFSSVPSRSYEIMGLMIQVPNGYVPTVFHPDGTITQASYPTTWDGTFDTTLRWTNNPAWIFYDLITNKRYGLGNYISTSVMDVWSLYEIAQYCDELVDDGDGGLEPRFTCNVVIANREDAFQVLQNLTSVFRGMMYWGNGLIFTTQTSEKQPLLNYTNANVVDGRFSYSDTATNTRSTVIMVKWSDPDNSYRETTEYIEDRAGIERYGYITKEVTAFGCTSRGQAYRLGNWILQSERILTETVTFQVGLEGLYVRPGDVFNVYDNFRNNRSQGGRINSFNAERTVVTLDRLVEFDPNIFYSLSAVVPAGNDLTGITGSSQLTGVRASQIEVKRVMNSSGTEYSMVEVDTAFGSEIYPGSVFIVSCSGTGSIFQKASIYKCLATSEPNPGIVEILGLQYDTGITAASETNYTTVVVPPNEGDDSAISPASDLTASIVEGIYSNNSYYRYIQLDWTASPSENLSSYIVSGKPFGGSFTTVATPTQNTYNYTVSVTGFHDFRVIAVSRGGKQSSAISASVTVPGTSPVGPMPALSGIEITANYDPNYTTNPLILESQYTGYVGNSPTLKWTLPVDSRGVQVSGVQFVSGYKVYIQNPDTSATYAGPFTLDGSDNTEYTIPVGLLNTGNAGNPIRCFKFFVQIWDDYGAAYNGGELNIDNPAPRATQDSGFFATRGGLNYAVVPQEIDGDISGVYIWVNNTGSFQPKFTTPNLRTTNLAGFSTNSLTGAYYAWFSLIDSYGTGQAPIFGPVELPINYWATKTELAEASGVLQSGLSGASGVLDAKINIVSGRLYSGYRETWMFACSDETTALTTGMSKLTFRAPYAATLLDVRATVNASGTAGLTTVDIRENGTSMLSTKITIDANEYSSATATTPPVISDSSIADDSRISVDVNSLSTNTAGLKVALYVQRV